MAVISFYHKIPQIYRKMFFYFAGIELFIQLIFHSYLNVFRTPPVTTFTYHFLTFIFQSLSVLIIWGITYRVIHWKWGIQIVFQLLFCLVFQLFWFATVQPLILSIDFGVQHFMLKNFEVPTIKSYIEDMKLMYYYVLRHAYKLMWIYAVYFFIQLKVEEEKSLQLALENRRLAMENLKFRINPDFYFYTLDLIKTLEKKQTAECADMILRLAEVMEYVIYNSKNANIDFEKECHFLEHLLTILAIKTPANSNIHHSFENKGFTEKIKCFLLGQLLHFFLFELDTKQAFQFFISIKADATQKIQVELSYHCQALKVANISTFLATFQKHVAIDYPNHAALTSQFHAHSFRLQLLIQC